ncbi:proline dehydrogenase family protein [Paenibacillus lupini]|uniref:proline dehydrogenase family protein n=1 Tax=Paenibacillus lupini TaxID=1450204 RepID=UPI00141D8378|nr:proline dehydrogenase family protein [Paenibacillus lupini]NIK23831.1 proline dehydrogenase [Paenibacillus lupini]
MGAGLYRRTLLTISNNKLVEHLSIRYGRKLASKFIAGDTLEEAMDRTEELNGQGIMVTLDHLGEGIKDLSEAAGYREEYLKIIREIAKRKVNANVSLKPTQFGLALDPEQCYANIRAVVSEAKYSRIFVRLDMEDTPYTQATIDIIRKLHEGWLMNAGTVIQAYLFRSEEDVKALSKEKVNLRLVKGAYKEPAEVAYQNAGQVLDNFKKLIELRLKNGIYTAVASHDDKIINWTKDYAAKNNIQKDTFEFQMLYGLRMSKQAELAQEGYRVRCYVPYGAMWYPYYTRRLAEKPANLMMVLKNMF